MGFDIYHEESIELCNLKLDNSFAKFKNLVCWGIKWNLDEFDVDITWKMLGGGHPNRYIGVLIIDDMSFNTMVGLITANELQILKLYLIRKPKVENSLSL